MLRKDKNKRINLTMILEHPWLKDTEVSVEWLKQERKLKEQYCTCCYHKIEKEDGKIKGLKPAPSHGVYNPQERNRIQAEFVYRDDVSYTEALNESDMARAFNDNRLDINDFQEEADGLLLNSTDDPLERNESCGSDILGPYNSENAQIKNSMDWNDEIAETGLLVDRDQSYFIMKFDPHVKQINIDYENRNNPNMDNGIYHGVTLGDGMESQDQAELKKAIERKRKKNQKEKEKSVNESRSMLNESQITQSGMEQDLNNKDFQEDFKINNKNPNQKQAVRAVERFGYEEKYIKGELKKNQNNHCTTTFYLFLKNQMLIV